MSKVFSYTLSSIHNTNSGARLPGNKFWVQSLVRDLEEVNLSALQVPHL